jgi:hypothetical protein
MICNRVTSRPKDPALVAFALTSRSKSGEPAACFRKSGLADGTSGAGARGIVSAGRETAGVAKRRLDLRVPAHSRAAALAATPGNRRRGSTVAENSPPCSKAVRIAAASA